MMVIVSRSSAAQRARSRVNVAAKDGTWRPSLEVIAAQVMALRQPKKPRPAKETAPPIAPAFDDALPF
jgi:hypothetical protein